MLKKIKNKLLITFWLIKIGDGFFEKINLLKWLYVTGRDKDITIKFKAFGKKATLTLPNNRDQLLTLRSIFQLGDWDIGERSDPKTIIDLGSYTGISVMYFFLKYPKAKIYAFEPDMESYKYLVLNFKGNERVEYYNIAVAEENGEVALYTPNSRSISSSVMPRGDATGTMVPSRTFDDICKNIEQVDLLKFNIEGGEASIFGTKSFVEKVEIFIGEVHEDLIPQQLSIEVFRKELLKYFNIEVKKVTKKGRAIWKGKTKK